MSGYKPTTPQAVEREQLRQQRMYSSSSSSSLRPQEDDRRDRSEERQYREMELKAARAPTRSSSSSSSSTAPLSNPSHNGQGSSSAIPGANPVSTPTYIGQGGNSREVLDFIHPYSNTLKSLLNKQDKLASSLDSLQSHQDRGSIPKTMQFADHSSQIPQDNVELRERIRSQSKNASNDLLSLTIASQKQELSRVGSDLNSLQDKVRTAYDNHLQSTPSLGFSQASITQLNQQLRMELQFRLLDEFSRIARQHKATIDKANSKRLLDEKKREAEKEKNSDKSAEDKIQDVVNAAVTRALNRSKQSSPAKSSGREGKASNKNRPLKNAISSSKKGNPRNTGLPPGHKEKDSGNRKPSRKKSGNGHNKQSTKSKRQ